MSLLILGFGNELCGDDAAGLQLAREAESWGLGHVRVLTAPQLLPELAEPISEARVVVLLDAAVANATAEIQWFPVYPARTGTASAHRLNPEELLALAERVFGRAPPAWLLAIPAVQFELGQPLSATTRSAWPAAVARLRQFVAHFAD